MWHPDLPESYKNQIVTGDARELAKAIPDESVDLVFTDPVYDRESDYTWLAGTCRRVLKPTGAVLIWSNGHWHRTNANWLERGGLVYRWEFAYVITGGAAPMDGKIIAKTNRLLWFDLNKCSRMIGYLADGYAGVAWSAPNMANHQWTKSPRFTAQALTAFTRPNTLVLDPFTGGGTVPAVCKMLGRNYIAFELDPNTAEKARTRVANTQPIMTGFNTAVEQGVML